MLSESEKRIVKNNETALLQKTRNNRSRNVTKYYRKCGARPPQKCYEMLQNVTKKCYKMLQTKMVEENVINDL